MENNKNIIICNKCGHVISDKNSRSLVMCPNCKNIKKVQGFNEVNS